MEKKKRFNPENRGCTPAVREKFLAMGIGHLPVPGRIIRDELQGTYKATLIAGSLNYLVKHKELKQEACEDGGWQYTLISHRALQRHFTPRVAEPSTYIGILLDDEKVILTVEGKTLEMKPAAFKALRAKLKSIDYWL